MIAELKKKERYQNFIQTHKTIVLTTDNKTLIKNLDDSRMLFKQHNCIVHMFLKRYFHKLYIGDRSKNEKSKFTNNMYLLCCGENFEFHGIKKILKKLNLKICGVLINNKYYSSNYNVIINSNFSEKNMLILLLLTIMKLFAVTVSLKSTAIKLSN